MNQPFWRSVFSEADGTGSASRVLTALLTSAVAFVLLYTVVHEHKIPDLGTLAGLAGFAVSPYAVNKGTQMLTKEAKP
jgi:uncharacterized membrane protein